MTDSSTARYTSGFVALRFRDESGGTVVSQAFFGIT